MYAVIKTGGKQYKVAEGDILRVEKLDGEPGNEVSLDSVLMVKNGEEYKVGRPFVEGANVQATILRQDRDRKVVVYHFKRRRDFDKTNGHRQPFTELKINAING